MATPNSLLLLGNLINTGTTPPVLPGNISGTNKPVNFYIIQKRSGNLIAPIIQLEWTIVGVFGDEFFPFRREDGSIIQFTDTNTRGGLVVIPRLNSDVEVRVNVSGDVGIDPNIDFFIG